MSKPELPQQLDTVISAIKKKSYFSLNECRDFYATLTDLSLQYYEADLSMDKINFYLTYVENKMQLRNLFISHAVTTVATIFLPLTFLITFFCMPFDFLKPLYSMKNAMTMLFVLCIFIIIVVYLLIYILSDVHLW